MKNNIEQTKSDRIKQSYMDKFKDKEVKKSMRQDKWKWIDHLVMEAEEAARNGRMILQKSSVMTNVRQQMQ